MCFEHPSLRWASQHSGAFDWELRPGACGQLTLLRMLVELDKPVPIESLRRAERLARSLESDPVELEP